MRSCLIAAAVVLVVLPSAAWGQSVFPGGAGAPDTPVTSNELARGDLPGEHFYHFGTRDVGGTERPAIAAIDARTWKLAWDDVWPASLGMRQIRSVASDGKRVCALGIQDPFGVPGHLRCYKAKSGKITWEKGIDIQDCDDANQRPTMFLTIRDRSLLVSRCFPTRWMRFDVKTGKAAR